MVAGRSRCSSPGGWAGRGCWTGCGNAWGSARRSTDPPSRRVAEPRRIDGAVAERVVFALVAQRALEPGSKLACTRWVAERVFVEHLPGLSDDAAYRAMDFLLEALNEIAAEVFASVAHLLNLDVDLVFVDTTSTHWEVDVPDELADALRNEPDDDEVSVPAEAATRRF